MLETHKLMLNIIMRFFLPAVFWFLTACQTADKPETASEDSGTEREKHRPAFHFTPPSMWMNDPNGMVFHNGEYHLFYQHYPDSTVWGPMHWGHAVSKDLVHWQHLPIALYPDSLGYIFSGSAVFDKNNTSGLGTKGDPPLVAIYTYHSDEIRKTGRKDYQTQGIAWSVDNGRTWTKYAQNPVLKNPGIEDFRDPKVFWHDGTERWIMILAVRDHVEIYGSKDLKQWEKLSEFGKNAGAHGGVWECPDLFPLTVDGQSTQKWVMLMSINPGGIHGGSATQYFIGEFDGRTFLNDNPSSTTLWMDFGKDNYAGVTWANLPDADERKLFMGWMSNWQYANVVPTENWRSAMTIPRTLHLKEAPEGIRLASVPAKEMNAIRKDTYKIASDVISGNQTLTDVPFNVSTSEIILDFTLDGKPVNLGIEMGNSLGDKIVIGFDAQANRFYIDRTNAGRSDFSKDFAGVHYAPRISEGDSLTLRLIFDVASVEVFADGGTVVMTDIFFPDEEFNTITLFSNDTETKLRSGDIWKLSADD